MNQTGEGHAEKTVGNTIESPRDQPRKTGRQSKRLRASRGSKRLFVHSSWVYRSLHAHSWADRFRGGFRTLNNFADAPAFTRVPRRHTRTPSHADARSRADSWCPR